MVPGSEREKLGEILVSRDLLTAAQLDEALAFQLAEGGKLGEAIVRHLMLTEDQIADALAQQKNLEHVNLTRVAIDRHAAALLPERVAKLRHVVPIAFEGDLLVLAMSDPLDIATVDDVELRTGHRVRPVVATRSQIEYAIQKYIATADAFEELLEHEAEYDAAPLSDILESDNVPVVRMVNQLITEAVQERASDIHLEPMADQLRVRYRIDGVLTEARSLPRSVIPEMVSRVKIMADMDISERRRPQDGRIAARVEDRPLDLRVASLPTPHGESIVIRLLNPSLTFRSLHDLGLSDQQTSVICKLLTRPWGAVILCGPTGSGKSTTMYAALGEMETETQKVITIEDPIEYRMPGVTQMAVHPKIGLTFATGLRTILRADPDVVMIGEIRDSETASIAVRASLTGHLVLTSLHTNDAPSALPRLVDMGVPGYVVSSAVIGVIAQRLARRLCAHCKKPVSIPAERMREAGFDDVEISVIKLYGPEGCDICHQTGFLGRVGIFEIMPLNDDIVRAFLDKSTAEEIRHVALSTGMRSLRRDALDKVAAGLTSLEEIDRVVV